MRIVVFGLSISSSWGNGHATLWRSLARGLAEDGHHLTFFERDVPYYAAHRDRTTVPGGELVLYESLAAMTKRASAALREADVGMVTSYCPDAEAATELVLSSPVARRVFYDLDTPVTLARLDSGETVPYLPTRGLGDFDLVFSFTGGRALERLETSLGARRAVPLYGSVDPDEHRPAASDPRFASDLSYLGTYSDERQARLDALLLEPARRRPRKKFLIGGSLYPDDFPWTENLYYVSHVPPADHPAFYASSPLTLNVTREPMAALGYCPSGRLFEAAACGVPVLSDAWEGLGTFFEPDREILIAHSAEESITHLERDREVLRRMGSRARDRVLAEHTGKARARTMIEQLMRERGRSRPPLDVDARA